VADSVLLSGAAARIEFAPGSANIDFAGITMLAAVKATAAGLWGSVMVGQPGFYRWGFSDVNEIFGGDGTTENFGGPVVTTTTWGIFGVTHTAVSDQPHYHWYNGTSWVHNTPSGAAVVASIAATTSQDISESGGDAFQGNVLISGIKDAVMSDGEIEALAGGYKAWKAAGFLEGIRFNAASGLASYTGGSMAQGTTVGASLDVGDAPTWWDDSLETPPVQPSYRGFPKPNLAGRH
jgi:hypothetical protein